MTRIKHIRYTDTGREEFVSLDKYSRLHENNAGIELIGEKDV